MKLRLDCGLNWPTRQQSTIHFADQAEPSLEQLLMHPAPAFHQRKNATLRSESVQRRLQAGMQNDGALLDLAVRRHTGGFDRPDAIAYDHSAVRARRRTSLRTWWVSGHML